MEVGVWKGESASYLAGDRFVAGKKVGHMSLPLICWHVAGWLKQQNRGVFLAVDTWLGASTLIVLP